MPEPEMSQAHPDIKAVLICDHAIREEGTGKISLIGIFEDLRARTFPIRHALLCVYVKLTDAAGAYKIRLELVRLGDLKAVGLGELDVNLVDRNRAGEIVFQLVGLVFERPGRYDFRLYANGRYLGSKTLNVVELASLSEEGDQS